MKCLLALLTALLLTAHGAVAQENAPAEKLDLIPSQPTPLTPSVTPAPLPLIPESPDSTKKPKGSGAVEAKKTKKSVTEAEADDLQQRIRYRQVKTRAFNDPGVQAEWERAHVARTDYEKREALKSYYKLLFSRMRRIDGTLKRRIALEEERVVRRLTQTRIDPTEPLDPEDRAERYRE
jgi:hypothetical protein